jgi:AcrR family transcriptional regulator
MSLAQAETVVVDESPAQRVVEALLRCVCRWGVAKTTLDDVAREAKLSRATVYRLFPGGKDAVLDATARTEIDRFFAAVGRRLDEAESLEDALVVAMTEAGRRLRDHEALQYLLAHEPQAILTRLAFAQMDQVLRLASTFATPHLSRWLAPEDAARAGEWAARLVCSYSMTPGDGVDFEDEGSVRALVRSFVMPGLTPVSSTPVSSTNP